MDDAPLPAVLGAWSGLPSSWRPSTGTALSFGRLVLLAGRQDPYCVITIGQRTFRSTTHTDGGKNPVRSRARERAWHPVGFPGWRLTAIPCAPAQVWNQTFSFTGVNSESVLRLEVRQRGHHFGGSQSAQSVCANARGAC